MKRAGILLDRDGTIINDYHYVGRVERVQLIPGAADAIASFNRAGIPVAIITNQSGVARGFYPERNIHLVHEYIMRELALHDAHVDLFLYSAHHPQSPFPQYRHFSQDHKPNPGMAFRAAEALHLDLTKSIVVGDRLDDMALASKIGAEGLYLGATPTTLPHKPFPSLAAAASYIIERITGVSQITFPSHKYTSVTDFWGSYLTETFTALHSVAPSELAEVQYILQDAIDEGRKIFVAGNGGAAAIASHFACDHVKGISTDTHWSPQVQCLNDNTPLLTAIANDIGYDSIFSYQLERFAAKGDVLLVFSVSGNSANIVRALQCAQELDMQRIAVLGRDGGQAMSQAQASILIMTGNYGVAEDVMGSVQHALAQFIRQAGMASTAIETTRF
jgi:D,D-heptose 1,7-bisphosphate phosphatase